MAMDANGRFTRVEATYIVFGAASEEEALRGVRESAPAEWEGLPLDSLEISGREADEVFLVDVSYRDGSSSGSSSGDDD